MIQIGILGWLILIEVGKFLKVLDLKLHVREDTVHLVVYL